MELCYRCLNSGFCAKQKTKVVSDTSLSNPYWLRDFKFFLVLYSYRNKIPPSKWADHLSDLYCRYLGWIAGPGGEEIFLNTEVFELPHIREWFRDFIQIVPNGVTPHVNALAFERVRVMATIMAAHHPISAVMWGVRPANDN